MGRVSVTPLVLRGSALSGDSRWAWSASCFTILEGELKCHIESVILIHIVLVMKAELLRNLLDHQLSDALTVSLIIEPNTVDTHCKRNTNIVYYIM